MKTHVTRVCMSKSVKGHAGEALHAGLIQVLMTINGAIPFMPYTAIGPFVAGLLDTLVRCRSSDPRLVY